MNIYDEYDIIIEGGQSNAEGAGIGPVSKFEPFRRSSEILYLTGEIKTTWDEEGVHVEYPNHDFTIEIADERPSDDKIYSDFSLAFAQDYIKNGLLKSGRKLLIIRAAVGATSFYRNQWGLKGSVYAKMIEMIDYAIGLNSKNKIVAFLWHQGEGDTGHLAPNVYKQCLKDTLNDVRNRYGVMPFVAANFVPEWIEGHLENCQGMAKAYREFIAETSKAVFVESDGLMSNNQKLGNGDKIHFCRESLYELGHRYYDAFSRIR